MVEWLAVVLLGAAAVAGMLGLRAWMGRRRARRRLAVGVRGGEAARVAPAAPIRPAVPRRRWLAGAAAALVGLILVLVGAPIVLLLSLAAVAAILAWLAEDFYAQTRLARMEAQLGDAIDIMVGAMRAGSSVVWALDAATQASGPPLRPTLEEVVGRLKLADDPQAVLRELTVRVPLDSFRLFAFTLGVHWEGGGSLAPALATTGRVIRDRLELARRIRTQSAEALASVVGIMAIVYVLAYLLWSRYPERTVAFFVTTGGTWIAAMAVLLQALGLLWVSRLTRVRA